MLCSTRGKSADRYSQFSNLVLLFAILLLSFVAFPAALPAQTVA
jgi:hypothetical protein